MNPQWLQGYIFKSISPSSRHTIIINSAGFREVLCLIESSLSASINLLSCPLQTTYHFS